MKSALYSGHVAHARFGPTPHRLRYRLFMLALDLDEIPALDKKLRLFSHNRANLYSFNDADHRGRTAQPLRPQIEQRLREAGVEIDGGVITLLTMPRLLGYVFNPLSVYFCYRRDGALAAMIYEVSNTFGERHDYVLPAHPEESGEVLQRCEKAFFVSPFLGMDLGYEFRIAPPGEAVSVAMTVKRGGEAVLTASFAGKRQPLTDRALVAAFLSDPLMTFKAIAGIHWEAVKMLAKGVPFLGRGRRRRIEPMRT
ncbi:MAG: DUF1365 family protein [Terricaulis sp.]